MKFPEYEKALELKNQAATNLTNDVCIRLNSALEFRISRINPFLKGAELSLEISEEEMGLSYPIAVVPVDDFAQQTYNTAISVLYNSLVAFITRISE